MVALLSAGTNIIGAAREGQLLLWDGHSAELLREIQLVSPPNKSVPSAADVHVVLSVCAHPAGLMCLTSNGEATLWESNTSHVVTSVQEYSLPRLDDAGTVEMLADTDEGLIPTARVAARIGRVAPTSVDAGAPQFMSAVLEVVASEMLQRAGDAAAASSSGRVEPHHILSAVRGDEELTRLVGSDALEQGGLLQPHD